MTYRKLAALVSLAVVIVLAATLWRHRTTDTPPPSTSSTSIPSTSTQPAQPTATFSIPAQADEGTPDAVAAQAMTVAHTWTPGLDASPSDAFRRAAGYFTPRLTDLITVNTGTDVPPSLQWENWATKQARIIADTTIGCSGCPPDTDTTAYRVATITQTATTGSTTTRVEPDTTIWLTLTHADTGWLIDELRY